MSSGGGCSTASPLNDTGLTSTLRLDSGKNLFTAKTVGHATPMSTPETSISSEPSYNSHDADGVDDERYEQEENGEDEDNPEHDDIPEDVGLQGGGEIHTGSEFDISGILALQE